MRSVRLYTNNTQIEHTRRVLGPLARVRFWFFCACRERRTTEPNAATSKPDLVAGDERYRSPCSFAFIYLLYGAATTSRPWAEVRSTALHMCADIYGTGHCLQSDQKVVRAV